MSSARVLRPKEAIVFRALRSDSTYIFCRVEVSTASRSDCKSPVQDSEESFSSIFSKVLLTKVVSPKLEGSDDELETTTADMA